MPIEHIKKFQCLGFENQQDKSTITCKYVILIEDLSRLMRVSLGVIGKVAPL